jgi:hypothetical protein
MKKRLIDIYPPQTKQEILGESETPVLVEEKESPQTWKGMGSLVCFLIFLVAAPLTLHFFFAKASIAIWPEITQLHLKEQLLAQVGYDKMNLEKKIIRARVFEEDKQLTQLFPATGKKFKEEKARGTIRVYNQNSGQSQRLVANTRFISEDGKLFRLQRGVSIPPGFLDVEVEAAAPGQDYNIGPSKFSLPGLAGSALYTKIYGESFGPMAGGKAQEILVVTEEDIQAAKDRLLEMLKAQATQALVTKIPPPYQLLESTLVATVLEDSSLVKPGAELNQFNYTAKVRVAMSGFHAEDAEVLARQLLLGYLAPNEAVNENTLQINFRAAEQGENQGAIPIEVQIEAERYERIDAREFSERVSGVSKTQFRQLMAEYPFLAKVEFSFWPFWISKVPRNLERINLDVRLDS